MSIQMSTEGKGQSENPKSDTKQKLAFAEFLKHVKGVDVDTINTKSQCVDVEAKINGIYKFFELKTSGKQESDLEKQGYFGAATITEWKKAVENPQDFYFVYVIGNEKEGYKYMIVKAEDIFSYSMVPPFKINININIGRYLNKFKALSKGDMVDDIDAEVIQLEPKERRKSRKSLGVNDTIIKRLCELYKGLKEEYFAQFEQQSR